MNINVSFITIHNPMKSIRKGCNRCITAIVKFDILDLQIAMLMPLSRLFCVFWNNLLYQQSKF